MTSLETAGSAYVARARTGGRLTRVAAATMVGTAIEAFDFLAYGTAAALVFNTLYFPNVDPTAGTLAAFGPLLPVCSRGRSAESFLAISATGSGARPC